MQKISHKKPQASKKLVKPKHSPKSYQIHKTLEEIYSSQLSELQSKKLQSIKKPSSKKPSSSAQRNSIKKPKSSKLKKFIQSFPQIQSSSDTEQVKKPSKKSVNANEVHNKKLMKTSSKFNGKVRSPTSELVATLKSSKAKIFDLVKTRLKSSKIRSVSSRRSSKELKKNLKANRSNSLGRPLSNMEQANQEKFEKISFQHPATCRENYYEDPEFHYRNLEPCKTHKVNKKTISLMDTEEFGDFQEFDRTSNDMMKKTKKIFNLEQDSQNSVFSNQKSISLKKNSEQVLENFKRNHAARVIQRNFRIFLKKHTKVSTTQLEEIVKEQISWKEAQILALEYLKQKELEDLQFLAGVLGRNVQLEEVLAKAVQTRYDNFSKVFKDNLEGIELKYKETVKNPKVPEASQKQIDTKEVVNKIIHDTNINSSLSKLQVESLVKESKEMTIKVNNIEEETKSESRPRQVIKSNANELNLNDIEQIDPTMLSPILPEIMNFPDLSSLIIEEERHENNGLIPEPCDKFEDFSLEALISGTPCSNIPLLKLEEIKDMIEIIPSDKRIMTHSEFIYDYLKEVFFKFKEEIIVKVSKPVLRDPLEELEKIHNDFNDFEDRFIYEPVIDVDKALKTVRNEAADSTTTTDRQVLQADIIHKKMLLAASDEIFQYFRPYNVKGTPQLWSLQDRQIGKRPLEAEEIMNVFLGFITGLSLCQVGKIPTENMILSNGHLDDAALAFARNEALEFTLKKDILDYEWIWNDFEFEETQVKLDMADILLSDLAEELVNLI